MPSIKLAFKNVGKSIREYVIYFLTLALGVCVFYVFNAMDSQALLTGLSAAQGGGSRNARCIYGFYICLGFRNSCIFDRLCQQISHKKTEKRAGHIPALGHAQGKGFLCAGDGDRADRRFCFSGRAGCGHSALPRTLGAGGIHVPGRAYSIWILHFPALHFLKRCSTLAPSFLW